MRLLLTRDEWQITADVYREEFPEQEAFTRKVANESSEGRFRLASTMAADRWVEHGMTPDWLHNPTEDLEYTWLLNRHGHFYELGKAYTGTGDKKYPETFVRHIRSWRMQNPVPIGLSYEQSVYFQKPGPWRLLEVGLRVQAWIWGWLLMSDSPILDTVFVAELKEGLVEHARYLSSYLGDCSINHATMHMQGLHMIGMIMEAHPEAPYWLQLATERLELCLHKQIREDGVQEELTPSYHNASIHMFGTPYGLAKQMGRPFSRTYTEKLRSMATFSCATVRPDGGTSPLSDSDVSYDIPSWIGFLGAILEDESIIASGRLDDKTLWQIGAERFKQLRLSEVERRRISQQPNGLTVAAADTHLAQQQAGTEPQTVVFPHSGYYLIRDRNNHLFFDAAPMGGAHGHADVLHFEWMFKQCLLFSDPGRYTYEEGDWRRYFKGTSAHNTVTIDQCDQTTYVSTQQWGERAAEPTVHRWLTNSEYDFIDASHDGYMRLAQPVTHRRWLLLCKKQPMLLIVDWLEGEGAHQMEQSFQLTPSANLILDKLGQQVTIEYGEQVTLQMSWSMEGISHAEHSVKSGWISPNYGFKEPIPVLGCSGSFTGMGAIAVICIPESCAWDQRHRQKEAAVVMERMQLDLDQRSMKLVWSCGEVPMQSILIDTHSVSFDT
ncbi:heparinase II/III family protein [Paenibacillus sp. WQ 127069]|uniref:Heparinase II/III family protein n=1 Tax=Paenibacillus baimaensis TaxID=2982185 RepID=A0ABT2US61_9BACL|nr:alginate lyase family protein [Paenibacillus sp. WQ 127069]MCU6797493.1 heparinase II/III family protein [Paenibacillus sp. WQ 127069]